MNPGSASRKYAFYENKKEILSVRFEKDGSSGGFIATYQFGKHKKEIKLTQNGFEKSMSMVIDFSIKEKFINDKKEIAAIGFRIVAPGGFFNKVRTINADYIKKLKAMREAAPLHIGPALSEIEKAVKLLPATKKLGVSDSAFHSTMPEVAITYGIPLATARKLEIRRFGFHGTSVESVLRKVQKKFKKMPGRIIICHLGSGASITAIKNGASIDTSMGFTPLEGVLMGTRSGDIDAGALIYLAKKLKLSYGELDEYLNKKSGLLGVSGKSSDVRELLALEKKNPKTTLALDIFVYRIKKYIGAYTAALGGLDLLIFTATIGERSDIIRGRICHGLEPLGIVLDKKKNKETTQGEGFIQTQKSKVKIAVIKTNETEEIALKIQDLN